MLVAGRMLEWRKAAWTVVMPCGVSPPEELGGVTERIGGRGRFQENVGVGVDTEVVTQQTAVCRDGDQLIALDVFVDAFPVRAGQLQGGPVLEVGGHLVVGHALDRPRGVRGLHRAQGVDLLQVPREEGTQAGFAQLGVENRGPLADVGVAAPGAGGQVGLV